MKGLAGLDVRRTRNAQLGQIAGPFFDPYQCRVSDVALRQAGAPFVTGQYVRIAVNFERLTIDGLRIKPGTGGKGDAIGAKVLGQSETCQTCPAIVVKANDIPLRKTQ